MKRSIEDTPVVFLGAGNLATNLAKALYRKGFRIMQVYSRTEESARTLANEVEAEYITDLKGVSNEARLYIISLKDAASSNCCLRSLMGSSMRCWYIRQVASR